MCLVTGIGSKILSAATVTCAATTSAAARRSSSAPPTMPPVCSITQPLSKGRFGLRGEVVDVVEVGDEPGLCGVPVELLLGEVAGGRDVQREDGADQAEVRECVFGGDGGDGQLGVPADHLGGVTDGHALVGDSVQSGARG